jgi:hypothetical protein
MGSYTNVWIPNFTSRERELFNENEELRLRLKRVTSERDSMVKELENIVKAVQEWGYVEIKDEVTCDGIKLVKAPEEPKEGG